MNKSIKHLLLPLVLFSLVFTGCDDLFSTGDTELTYEGPDQVAFFPLQTIADEGTTATIEVQLITAEGLATSDVTVGISVDSEASTVDGDDYSLSTNSVTISSGTATSTFTVTLSNDADDAEEVLVLNLTSDNVQVAENLSTARIFIQPVADE